MSVQVIDTRNAMFHSSTFKEKHSAMKRKIKQMIDLLEAKELARDSAAQEAVIRLKEVSHQPFKCL